jgi:hypothetical protein
MQQSCRSHGHLHHTSCHLEIAFAWLGASQGRAEVEPRQTNQGSKSSACVVASEVPEAIYYCLGASGPISCAFVVPASCSCCHWSWALPAARAVVGLPHSEQHPPSSPGKRATSTPWLVSALPARSHSPGQPCATSSEIFLLFAGSHTQLLCWFPLAIIMTIDTRSIARSSVGIWGIFSISPHGTRGAVFSISLVHVHGVS